MEPRPGGLRWPMGPPRPKRDFSIALSTPMRTSPVGATSQLRNVVESGADGRSEKGVSGCGDEAHCSDRLDLRACRDAFRGVEIDGQRNRAALALASG